VTICAHRVPEAGSFAGVASWGSRGFHVSG
jgi:hypothetical protein